jgi:Protein of unknown function (DUF2857)
MMIMQTNNYIHWINSAAILAAANALRSNDMELIHQLGLETLDKPTAEKIKQLTADHLICLNSFKGSLLKTRIDPKQFQLFLDFAKNKTDDEDLVDKAIQAGLRQPALEELKGISRREYSIRRERLNLPEARAGRPEVLSEEDELMVLRAWNKLESVGDPLERLLTVFEQTRIPLDKAYLSIKALA